MLVFSLDAKSSNSYPWDLIVSRRACSRLGEVQRYVHGSFLVGAGSLRLGMNNLAVTNPNKKPPMCAHQAIPSIATPPNINPLASCERNHTPRKMSAGMSINQGNMKRGMNVSTLARGKSRK
jgi:hypothetical protein